ncbi:MAG: hypothetical protein MR673_03280 [Fusobacterium perfoetens]|uniref:hypothetical protein n=1 Tax=Fusobacterium perfoetens TaxID=852 RepID=UPI0023F071CA|nr:hypothetical protein [Fusobacterium perfoetens]MCI6152134.1 hypothetical protein [Fusobacterium perfoetens]MDY3237975.1 hypothetical protein [Fusobacterium perfoetens]
MGNKIKKFIMLLTVIFGITLFASEGTEVPNQLITENPDKEVTTVESMKVRDHATMSLSITKSNPEEIMGNLSEDGNLSVFIYKKQARMMARNKNADISNFKLKAYTNTKNNDIALLRANTNKNKKIDNLTAEDIRHMKDSRESSKEKRIDIIEETNEYVRLRVRDVRENEKVYISVMNGNNVVKSYRIGNVTRGGTEENYCWWSMNLDWGIQLGDIYKNNLNSNDLIQINCDNGNTINNKFIAWKEDEGLSFPAHSGLNNITVADIKPNTLIEDQDEYNKNNNAKVSGEGVAHGVRFFINSLLPVNTPQSIYHYYFTNVKYGEFDKTAGADIQSDSLDKGEAVQISLGSKKYKTFKSASGVVETATGSCTLPSSNQYKSTFSSVKVAFNSNIEYKGMKPGVYYHENALSVTCKGVGNHTSTLKSSYYIDFTDTTTRTKTQDLYNIVGGTTILTESKDSKLGLSFITKNNKQVNNCEVGIWKDNEKLPYSDNPQQDGLTITSGNSTIKISGTQDNGGYMKLHIYHENASQNDARFNFTLKQGRKVNNELRAHRTVTYNLTWKKTNDFGTSQINLDKRITQNIDFGKWVKFNGEIYAENGNLKSKFPELVGYNSNGESTNIPNTQVTKIESINDVSNSNLSYYPTNNSTHRHENYLAIPRDVSLQQYKIANGKIYVSREGEKTNNTFLVQLQDNNYWSGKVIKNYATNSSATLNGSGTLDMTEAVINTEYVFAPNGNQGTGNGSTISFQNGGKSFDSRGMLLKNNKFSIADKIVFTINGQSQTHELSNTTSSEITSGVKIPPVTLNNLDSFAIGISENGGLIIKKLKDVNTNTPVTIKYYLQNKQSGNNNDVELGTYNLTIISKINKVSIGESKFKIDNRLSRVKQKYTLLATGGLINGSGSTSVDGGEYPELITTTQFANISNVPESENPKITNTKMDNENKNGEVTLNSIKYHKYLKGSSLKGLLPVEVELKNIYKHLAYQTNTDVIGDSYNIEMAGNTYKKYTGKITKEIVNNYNEATATLDITGADKDAIGTWDSNASGTSGILVSNKFKLQFNDANQKLFNTKDINNTKKIVDKIKIDGTEQNLPYQLDLNSDGTKDLEININENGQLTIKKLTMLEKNIENYQIVIIPMYQDLELGKLTLTIKNVVKELSGTPTYKIDKRLLGGLPEHNWLFPNGKVKKGGLFDITTDNPNGNTSTFSNNYSKFFKFSGQFTNLGTGTIVKALSMEGRETDQNNNDNKIYKRFIKNGQSTDEGAIPKQGVKLTELNDKFIVSKYQNVSLDNKFSILVEDNGNYIIYKGNVVEDYKGGVSIGSGTIDVIHMENNVTYEFNPNDYTQGQPVIGKNNDGTKTLEMTNVTNSSSSEVSNPLPNGNTNNEVTSLSKIANKITVNETTNNGETATIDGLTFGIGDNGGLTVSKNESVNIKDEKNYTIKMYYSKPEGDILLSEFSLKVSKLGFEIDGDSTLEFRDMVWRPNKTTETREKEFTVINHTDKTVTFEVKNKSLDLTSTTPGSKETINLSPIEIVKQTNEKGKEKFTLRATANLNENIPTDQHFTGEIEITVNISSTKK